MALEKPELLPCPFCGTEADYFSDPHDHGTDHIVDCRECNCQIICGRRESVIENWNRRDGDKCSKGCKITRAIDQMNDSMRGSTACDQIASDVFADVFEAIMAVASSRYSVDEQSRRLTRKIMLHVKHYCQ